MLWLKPRMAPARLFARASSTLAQAITITMIPMTLALIHLRLKAKSSTRSFGQKTSTTLARKSLWWDPAQQQ